MKTDEMIPVLMHLVRFHGKVSVRDIRSYTNYGKESIRYALNDMMKNKLIKKCTDDPSIFQLTKNSKYWLGWRDNTW